MNTKSLERHFEMRNILSIQPKVWYLQIDFAPSALHIVSPCVAAADILGMVGFSDGVAVGSAVGLIVGVEVGSLVGCSVG